MPSISVDASDALRLAADLTKAISGLEVGMRASVSKAALQIKNAMRADMAASIHFRAAPSITYYLSGNGVVAKAEIGPTKTGAGPISNIAYFGGAHGGGGTVRDPLEPALEELPAFEAAMDAILDGLL